MKCTFVICQTEFQMLNANDISEQKKIMKKVENFFLMKNKSIVKYFIKQKYAFVHILLLKRVNKSRNVKLISDAKNRSAQL